jgi:hypothetical protein
MIDCLALLAIGAFGWGLSLATYRHFARQFGWPMGEMQWEFPAVPVLIGLIAFALGLMFALARGIGEGGGVIIIFGFLLAIFWTGFLRVGSQVSLFLAPLTALILLVGWVSGPYADGRRAALSGSDLAPGEDSLTPRRQSSAE